MQGRLKLKSWLMQVGMRQQELAQRIGVGQNTISAWMAGRAMPNRESAYRIERLTEGKVATSDWSEE